MRYMFANCSSLKELNIDNFNTDNVKFMFGMFSGCSNELKMRIKTQNKNLNEEAFKNIY